MNKVFTITNYDNSERIRVAVHHEDSVKLIKLLTDMGFIDYQLHEDNTYDTNTYDACI